MKKLTKPALAALFLLPGAPLFASVDYACTAALRCANSANASLQELPTNADTSIQAADSESAAKGCQKRFSRAYQALQKRAPQGCTIQSHALTVTNPDRADASRAPSAE